MVRWLAVILLFTAGCISVNAQQKTEIELLMQIMGEKSPEEMDPDEVERFTDLIEHPMKINVVPLSDLLSSGLMSRYQAVSLDDYRRRHGDVLSLMELSAVDGFSEEFVKVLAPFISLFSRRIPGKGRSERLRVENDLIIRGGLKVKGSESGQQITLSSAGKYRCRIGENSSIALAFDGNQVSGHMSYAFDRLPLKIYMGDFNARFGQGLVMWNGMTMSGMTAPSAYMRRASSISESWSFTGSSAQTGVAIQAYAGSLNVSVSASLPGIKKLMVKHEDISVLPALNVSWNRKSVHLGFTHYAVFSDIFSPEPAIIPDMKTAVDISACFNGVDLFSEIACDWLSSRPAAIAGVVFPAGDALRMAMVLRYYPNGYQSTFSGASRSGTKCSNEYSASVSGELRVLNSHEGLFSIDAAYFPESKDDSGVRSVQLKASLIWEFAPSESINMSLRLSERLRSWGDKSRTSIRSDISWKPSAFSMTLRTEYLRCSASGLLTYLEGGFSKDGIKLYLRQGVFCIDDWADRIYVYERDAPGSFNVPAFYGRGIWTSFTGSWRFARWGKLYLRSSMTSYPFMKEKKPGKAELKLQLTFSF